MDTAQSPRNVVGWFEIYVRDLAGAQKFYEATFSVKLFRLPSPGIEMLAFPGGPELAGATGALVHMSGKDGSAGGTIVYFSCADCGAVAEQARSNGGRIFKPKMSIGEYGFIALILDLEGNLLGLHSLA